ncbi:MAG: Uma2 family endonuclease [Myxococcota bacterium]
MAGRDHTGRACTARSSSSRSSLPEAGKPPSPSSNPPPTAPPPPSPGKSPHVAVQLVSASHDARRDRVDKLADHAAFGIAHYGIVDPQLRTLELYERAVDGRYAHAL